MSSPRPPSRRLPLAGAGVALVLALAACGGADSPGTATAASTATAAGADAPGAPAPEPQPEAAPTTTATPVPSAPATTAPKAVTPTTQRRTTTPSAPPTTAAAGAPPTAPAPVTPTFARGQRIEPTSSQVQGAITALHQRIPLFEPTAPQLRTFADAACTSFDQGQTYAQVQSTIRQAITYVKGASLSADDADFALRTVLGLRCPGYLQ